MALDAQQVEALQNSVPTDWSKFDQTVSVDARTFGGAPGGLPPGMGPGHDDKLHVHFYMKPRIDIDFGEDDLIHSDRRPRHIVVSE